MSEHAAPAPVGVRLHALDNLRAILMWLGIVLHVAAVYTTHPMPNVWLDEQRTAFADALVSFIHVFRMPAFFILAGFFSALLAESRGPGGLLRNRLARLALPFVIFWPILWVLTSLAALLFLNRLALNQWGFDLAVAANVPDRGVSTMHMWFLWLLLWLCVGTAALMRLPRHWFAPAGAVLAWVARRPWGFALLALPLLAATAGYPRGFIVNSGSFLPPWNEWVHYGVYFAFGLMLHGQQAVLFAQFQRRWVLFAVMGLAFFLLSVLVTQRHGPLLLGAYSFHCAAWLWSFASIGLALRFLSSRHKLLGYLADSAYWVYLVHFPFTILSGALLYQLPLPALLKIAINIAATTLVCLGSYQLFVRHTWISQLLNGKRHPRPRRDLPGAAGGLA
jgi:glucans biosynthesis protein C